MVLGINMQESPHVVHAYIARHRLTFPQLLDGAGNVASMLAVPATPTTLLSDRAGQVVGRSIGYRDWAAPATHQFVESLLKAGQ